jgi:hypothetical protein
MTGYANVSTRRMRSPSESWIAAEVTPQISPASREPPKEVTYNAQLHMRLTEGVHAIGYIDASLTNDCGRLSL